ncbi:hypothetical protein C5C22_08975 [Rathayibacter rathayi]|nr:hypothetical protein C5C22_08975 [Rathayibacter rathayi]
MGTCRQRDAISISVKFRRLFHHGRRSIHDYLERDFSTSQMDLRVDHRVPAVVVVLLDASTKHIAHDLPCQRLQRTLAPHRIFARLEPILIGDASAMNDGRGVRVGQG